MAQSQQAKKKKKCSRLLLHEAIVTIATAPDKLKKQSKSSHRTLSDHTPNGTKLINLSGTNTLVLSQHHHNKSIQLTDTNHLHLPTLPQKKKKITILEDQTY